MLETLAGWILALEGRYQSFYPLGRVPLKTGQC